MTPIQDPDIHRSASHQHQSAHLTAPLQSGSVSTKLSMTDAGEVNVYWRSREPLVMAAPLLPLNNRQLRLDATLPDGAITSLTFAPYTETGAFLPLYLPPIEPDSQTAAPFAIALTLTEIVDGNTTAIPLNQIANLIEVTLLEGVMGRMIYLLGAEKQRLRRQGREIAAMRLLALARDDALDRMGAELGVPRFTETLVFQPPAEVDLPAIFGEFNFSDRHFGSGSDGEIITEPRREPDEEYRQRLAIYRPFLLPSRQRIDQLLNGTEDPATNSGLLGNLGVNERFRLIEADNEFAVAIHLIATGNDLVRQNFLSYVRDVHLILPASNEVTEGIHGDRYLPTQQRQQMEMLRTRLRQFFEWQPKAAIAPMLATVLDRLSRCLRALGSETQWLILRAYDPTGGSRYELGLGVDIPLIEAAALDQMVEQLQTFAISLPEAPTPEEPDPPEIAALLKSMQPRPSTEDPEGRWLLEPCGIRTVHRLNSDRLYLSHLPTFGMEIKGLSRINPKQIANLEVRYHAPGDPGTNIVLLAGMEAAATEWTAQGEDTWTVLTADEAQDAWDRAVSAQPAVKNLLRSVGLPNIAAPENIAERLARLPEELLITIRLADSQAQRILDGQPEATRELRQLLYLLRQQGLSSALPIVTETDEVLLVIGVIGLPDAGTNLAQRRATGFRWYTVPLWSSDQVNRRIKPIGSRTTFTADRPSLTALVAVGYARRGLTDPYEFRVELPDDAQLNLLQYEFLMNLLQHIHPLGVEVNTFAIRQQHVDLDGDGNADPLKPVISKTYRQFRRSRYRGENSTDSNRQ